MKKAEWAKLDIIHRPSSASALGLVQCFDLLNYGCPVNGFSPKDVTFLKDRLMPTNHWSRILEYPWALVNADLMKPGLTAADVGGGNNPFQMALAFLCKQVVNVDTALDKLELADALPCRRLFPNLTLLNQDVLTVPLKFDRVFCLSVLEHMPDPVAAVKHLKSMLNPGGRMLVTFDVTDSPCPDFPIGFLGAQRILAEFGLEMPSMENAFSHVFQIDEKPRQIWVMMFFVDYDD